MDPSKQMSRELMSPALREGFNDMVAILNDPNSDADEKIAAQNTLLDLLRIKGTASIMANDGKITVVLGDPTHNTAKVAFSEAQQELIEAGRIQMPTTYTLEARPMGRRNFTLLPFMVPLPKFLRSKPWQPQVTPSEYVKACAAPRPPKPKPYRPKNRRRSKRR